MSASTAFSLGGGGGGSKGTGASKRDFMALDPFSDSMPGLEANEQMSSGQVLHFVIVAVAQSMALQQHLCAKSFYGITDDVNDERLLGLVE